MSHVFDVYSDLFMLWLLYRFMKPNSGSEDDSSRSTILFAHDHQIAGDGLLESMMQRYDD